MNQEECIDIWLHPKAAIVEGSDDEEAIEPDKIENIFDEKRTKPEKPIKTESVSEAIEDKDTVSSMKLRDTKKKVKKTSVVTIEKDDDDEVDSVTFQDLKLSRPLMKAITLLNYKQPTPIQARSIPAMLEGKDIYASAQTGSGKTAAYVLPILERFLYRDRTHPATRVMIVLPTRELALQVEKVILELSQFTDITTCCIVGSEPMRTQESNLQRFPDIVVCTPGRMVDHLINSRGVHLDDLSVLVLDEADRLLEMGFKDEIEELIRHCPEARQTALFTATLSADVKALAALSLKSPVNVSTDPLFQVAKGLMQEFVRIRDPNTEKPAFLMSLCTRVFTSKTIIFFQLKSLTHRMCLLMKHFGLNAVELHGNLSQNQRNASLEAFKMRRADFLLATDVAGRGLDIKGVEYVINYDMPRNVKSYIHRVGRTARAGHKGLSVSFIDDNGKRLMKQLIRRFPDTVKGRTIDEASAIEWKAKISVAMNSIGETLKSESIDRQLDVAERDAKKAENMLVHHDEIMHRPAKEWFQTNREKEAVKEKAREESLGKDRPVKKTVKATHAKRKREEGKSLMEKAKGLMSGIKSVKRQKTSRDE